MRCPKCGMFEVRKNPQIAEPCSFCEYPFAIGDIIDDIKDNGKKNCPKCGVIQNKSAKFCKACGASIVSKKLVAVAYCSTCGTEYEKSNKYCEKDGTKLKNTEVIEKGKPSAGKNKKTNIRFDSGVFRCNNCDSVVNTDIEYCVVCKYRLMDAICPFCSETNLIGTIKCKCGFIFSTKKSVQTNNRNEKSALIIHAGFWKRFCAKIIDLFIGSIVGIVFNYLVAEKIPHSDVYALYFILSICYAWFYNALFESSNKQATPGKMALGIIVTDLRGNRIDFEQATKRHFLSILSALIFNIGLIMVAFTKRKQGLHDILSKCLVINR